MKTFVGCQLGAALKIVEEVRKSMKGLPGNYLDKLPNLIQICTKIPNLLTLLEVGKKEFTLWESAYKKGTPYRIVRIHKERIGSVRKWVKFIRDPLGDHQGKQVKFISIHAYFRGMQADGIMWEGTDDGFFDAAGITREDWNIWLHVYRLPN
jgi:hypothetical protein